ncbi:hypothetical protein V8E36_002261 [Tilletia maclaganii]
MSSLVVLWHYLGRVTIQAAVALDHEVFEHFPLLHLVPFLQSESGPHEPPAPTCRQAPSCSYTVTLEFASDGRPTYVRTLLGWQFFVTHWFGLLHGCPAFQLEPAGAARHVPLSPHTLLEHW